MKRHLIATVASLALASFAFAVPAGAVTGLSNPPVIVSAPGTVDFVKQTVNATRFEMASSRLALQKSQNADVKRFARMMLIDHSLAGTLLEKAVEDGHVSLLKPILFDADHQAMLDKLEAASPGEFDALYIEDQIIAHQEAVALFRPYASNGANSKLKLFAADLLPTLEMHLAHAKALGAKY